ncbi:acyl-CoA carboxylase subunit epsilon [Microbacterium flavescens]|uniref:acyl-CoA carboxylase subunit epsilon n=1 Tax=Microbacterium flavescens TaxID=69366 RepID=UPI001BDF532D|nr:acyl-CoA carboxylase subunit epsilon [Microbacterium flavescens]BFF10626.1 hypothetical protein GCM10025699_19290 [Microbacterium flavescens]
MSPADESAESVTIDILRGSATEEELAALIAVVGEAYATEAAEAVAPDDTSRSAWSLTQRNLRAPLRSELGWGRFSG